MTYMSWLGFFFFFRMAVAVSSCCKVCQFRVGEDVVRWAEPTNLLVFGAGCIPAQVESVLDPENRSCGSCWKTY